MRLEGRVALVTGGNTGIGRSIVEAFIDEGADIALNYLARPDLAAQVVAYGQAHGRRVETFAGDVTDEAFVAAMVEAATARLGRVDILVNNAGILDQVWFKDMTIAEWDRMIAVHLRGTFLCTHFVLPQMRARGSGKIINIASQLGQIGRQTWVHYSAAKAGIIGFTKALAREVSAEGVHVNAIAPGPISTGGEDPDSPDSRRLAASLPIGRLGRVGDVAPTAVFLASSDADFYVGQTLGPNGGDVML